MSSRYTISHLCFVCSLCFTSQLVVSCLCATLRQTLHVVFVLWFLFTFYRMRKLSLENRWRQSPHHVASRDAEHGAQRNGTAVGEGEGGSNPFPRIAASELRSTLTRQLTQFREVCSRRWTELAERFAQHRETWACCFFVVFNFTSLPRLLGNLSPEDYRQDFLLQSLYI